MTVIYTKNNNFLPDKYQTSDFPKIINSIKTLYNLDITKEIYQNNINYPNIYYENVRTYYKHFNEIDTNIVIIEHIELFKEIITKKYKLIEITQPISLNDLENLLWK